MLRFQEKKTRIALYRPNQIDKNRQIINAYFNDGQWRKGVKKFTFDYPQ